MTARGYVAWLARRYRAIVAAHLALLAIAVVLIVVRLPLHAELTDLLPQDHAAVVALHALEQRVAANDTVLGVVSAPDPATRAAVEAELAAAIRALPATLVRGLVTDRADARAYLWEHRFLLAPLDELRRVQAGLHRRIEAAELAANPLYIDLEDKPAAPPDRDLDELRGKARDLDATLHRPSNIDKSGRVAVLEIRTAMAATDIDRGAHLMTALATARADVIARHPTVDIGFAGDLVTAIAEHDAIVDGIVLSGIATAVLVGIVLLLFFRSIRLLAVLVITLVIATTIAFGAAALTVGHLNAATAFLGSIIAGNGINYGILLIARFREERERHELEPALAIAIAATYHPTIVAMLGAAVAYAALAAASFKGFAEFAVIGSVGMAVCWIASFVLLPALLLRHAARERGVARTRVLDRVLVGTFGFRHRRIVLGAAALVMVVCAVIAVRFVASDPFEYDMRELGSVSTASETERHWMGISNAAVGNGIAGRTIIAAQSESQIPLIVDALEAPARRAAIGQVASILSVVPAHQREKIAILDDIRRMIADAGDELSADDRARFLPPEHLEPVTAADLPASITELMTERSGRVGLVVSVRPAAELDELDGHDMIRFAHAIGEVELSNHDVITTSGASIVFAGILETIGHDGPRVLAVVLIGLAVLLLLVVGADRRSAAVMTATIAGALLMVATCALGGLRVTFLDLVALPVTLGLGVDYAINVAHRVDRDPVAMLRNSASAVFVCSLTTMIGYGSLLVSDNLAIRGYGAASLIGEITTVAAALVIVPALLSGPRSRG